MQLQPPTATHLRIRSVHDAHKLFHAVYMRMLPMVVRRLDAEERKMIKSGDVHVWEERGPGTEATGLGIERWTDGRLWGPSRVRDCFLFYHEKDREPEDFHGGSKWARMLSGGVVVFRRRADSAPYDDSSQQSGGLGVLDVTQQPPLSYEAPPQHYTPSAYPENKERLVKQTYSVIVQLPDELGEDRLRKWHMTAYFSSSQKAQQSLRTIDEIPAIAAIQVPDGMYEPARAGRGAGPAGRARSASTSATAKNVLVPPMPASMKYTSSANNYLPDDRDVHATPRGVPRYTPYQHRSTPASPTVEYDYNYVVPSQHQHSHHESPNANQNLHMQTNVLPPLQFSGANTTAPSPAMRLRPLSSISDTRSRSRSSSTSTSSTSLSSNMSPPTPSHLYFAPHSPTGLSLSPISLQPKDEVGSDVSLVPLSFLENVRQNLSQPAAWSSPSTRRAVDEQVVRGLEFRP